MFGVLFAAVWHYRYSGSPWPITARGFLGLSSSSLAQGHWGKLGSPPSQTASLGFSIPSPSVSFQQLTVSTTPAIAATSILLIFTLPKLSLKMLASSVVSSGMKGDPHSPILDAPLVSSEVLTPFTYNFFVASPFPQQFHSKFLFLLISAACLWEGWHCHGC